MNCLYITSKPIYPIVDGGCFAMDSFYKLLEASGMKIDHLAISTPKHPFDPKAYPKDVKVGSVEIDTAIKPLQALKFLVKKGSYNVERFHSEKMLEVIKSKISKHKFDLIILDSLYSTTYLPMLRSVFNGKIFLRSHNCEAQIWFDLAESEKSFPKSTYYNKLAKDIEKYECEVINSVDGVLAISEEDLDLFKRQHPKINACVIPVHFNTCDHPHKVATNKIFHIGSMDWIPNVEAVDRLKKIFNKARKDNPELTLHISGKNSDKLYRNEPGSGIHIYGFVEDLEEFAQTHGILVSPISSSSGVRIKILEMMSLGIPVITTNAGARGVSKKGRESMIIAESDEQLISVINSLTNDTERLNQMQNSALNYISEHHNLESIVVHFKNFLSV